MDRYLRERIVRRILHGDPPLAALVQVAAMRWLDEDTAGNYPRLAAAVLNVQGRRVAAAVLGEPGRRALAHMGRRPRRGGEV